MTLEPIPPEIAKCVKCVHRNASAMTKHSPCFPCVFYDNKPNYKEDLTVTTSKLDFFTAERYPQYAENTDNPKSKA